MSRAKELPRSRLAGEGLPLIDALVEAVFPKVKAMHVAPFSKAARM